MNRFEYTATTPNGDQVLGHLEADSPDEIRWKLIEKGLTPQAVRVVTAGGAGSKDGFLFDPRNWLRPRSVAIELTLRQTAVMLRSGLTLLAAIETIIEQPPSRAVRRVYEAIRTRIENGDSFADALRDHPSFPVACISMIALGEESGNLDMVMERSARSMESRRRNRAATLTALFYPGFTFLFAIGICVYMVIAVIPPMKKALESMGRGLPPITQSLLDAADFFTKWGPIIGVVALIVAVVFVILLFWPPGRLAVDRILLRIPLIGHILRTSATALFARSLHTLLTSGIPLVDGLRILETMHSNRYISAVVRSARQKILEGGTLASSLRVPHAYSPMMLRMIAVGESSGNLEETLEHVADFHDEQVQALIRTLSSFLEPVVIIVVGTLVGYVYIAFFVGLYGAMG